MEEKLTPGQTVKALCRGCLGISQLREDEITGCEGNTVGCTLYPYRLGKRISVKALRKYCLYCMNDKHGWAKVEDCTTKDCPNYVYRFGTNPAYQARDWTKAANRLKNSRTLRMAGDKKENIGT